MLFSELSKLKDIYNELVCPPFISNKESDHLKLSIADLMDQFIDDNPLLFSNECFHGLLKEYVMDNICPLLDFISSDKDIIMDHFDNIYHDTEVIYFWRRKIPPRSYDNTFVKKICSYDSIKDKIESIRNKPQPVQRTPEWYDFRHNLITASSLWKVFGTQSSINSLIVEKCQPLDLSRYNNVNTALPTHHGTRFEEVSIMIYEHLYSTKVEDFGCIKHDKFSFIGASPDGINIDPKSPLYGRMLEIKNPTTRVISGIPKEEYWIQMQIQMETCNLNDCDFLETSIKEYESEQDFLNDGTSFHLTTNGNFKGIILYFTKNGKPHYEYCPLNYNHEQFELWRDDIMSKNEGITWIQNIYWRLQEMSCVLVKRNKYWFDNAIPYIENIWNIITKEKKEGYEHRLPKKNIKPKNSMVVNKLSGCLINTNNLKNQIIYIDTKHEI